MTYARSLRKRQEKQVKKAMIERHAASAQRMKNPVIARHAKLLGQALIILAEHGASPVTTVITNVLDDYEAEIERLTALLEEKDANDL